MSRLHVMQLEGAVCRHYGSLLNLGGVASVRNQEEVARLSQAVAAFALQVEADLSPRAARDALTDGRGDNGIDAIHFDPHEKKLYIAQSKWISNGSGSPSAADAHKFLRGVSDLVNLRFERFRDGLRQHVSDVTKALTDPNVTLLLIIAYTGQQPLSPQVRQILNDFLVEQNVPSEVASIRVLDLKKLHRLAAGLDHDLSVTLDIALREWGRLDEAASFYGLVNAGDVANWFEEHHERLFSRNVRQFVGDTGINAQITKTLVEDPEMFAFLNNGITIIAEEVRKTPQGGGNRASGYFIAKHCSVVNGAQTVGSIARAYRQDPDNMQRASVFVRVISLSSKSDDFDLQVTKATNTQNRIERRDFAALDGEQLRLAAELRHLGWRYVYRTGEQSPVESEGCEIEQATIALACVHADISLAVLAKREIGRLWEDIRNPPYTLLFNEGTTGEKVKTLVEVFRIVENQIQLRQELSRGREALVAVHGNRFILHHVFQTLIARDLLYGVEDENRSDAAKEITVDVLQRVSQIITAEYESAFLNSFFKNASRCKELSSKMVTRQDHPLNLFDAVREPLGENDL